MTKKMREAVEKAETLEDVKGKCYFCGKEVDGWMFCYGCNEFVCEDCEDFDAEHRPGGPHRVQDHKQS